jgi:hypothetical protein
MLKGLQGLRAARRLQSVCAQFCSATPEYASTCILPTDWVDHPLVNVIDYNHDR